MGLPWDRCFIEFHETFGLIERKMAAEKAKPKCCGFVVGFKDGAKFVANDADAISGEELSASIEKRRE